MEKSARDAPEQWRQSGVDQFADAAAQHDLAEHDEQRDRAQGEGVKDVPDRIDRHEGRSARGKLKDHQTREAERGAKRQAGPCEYG